MTINQTIYGVSRELIEHAIEALTRHLDQHAPMQVPPSKADSDLVREELRALLDADKVNNRQMGLMQFVEAHPLKPAAQPQGEPVARVEIGADRNAALTITNDNWLRSLKARGVHQIVPLYAEQPAPVAVLMSFDFEHPSSKERRTVALSKQDVFDGMEDYFYDKLGEQICRCEPVGETNVVDCSCDEYVHDFEIVKASLTS